jgi:hypothetical protein
VPLSELTAHAAVVDRRLGSQWGAYRLPSRLGLALRLQLAMRIARSLAAVHDDGRYVLGDLKPDNLLVTCDGRVALVDCDSVQVVTSGETLFGSLVRTDDYVPPEGFDPAFIARWKEGEALESSWDAFSLAVILYQLLLGIHPFAVQGRDAVRGVIVDTVRDAIRTGCYAQGARRSQTIRIPAPHHQFARLPSTIRAALQRSLEDGHHDPTARLSPAEWLEVLTPHVLPQWRLTGYRRSVHIVAGIRASAIKVRGSAYRLTLSLDVFLTRLGQLWSDRRFELPDVRWRDTVGFWLGTFAWSAVDLLLLNPEPGTPQYLPPASIVPLRTAQVSVGDSLTAAPLLGPIVDPLVVGPDSTNSVVMAPPMVLTFARAGILVQRDSVVAHGPSAVVVVRQLLTAQPSGEYVVMVRYERTVEGLLRTTPTDTLLLLPSQARLGDHWWSLHGTPRRISAVRLGTMGTMGAYAPGVELRSACEQSGCRRAAA